MSHACGYGDSKSTASEYLTQEVRSIVENLLIGSLIWPSTNAGKLVVGIKANRVLLPLHGDRQFPGQRSRDDERGP